MNCAYCAYGTGLIEYARGIVAHTEQFWCPIKHARRLEETHALYHHFFDYGDGERYRKELERLRREFPPG